MQTIKSFFGLIILAAIAALVYVGLNNSRMMPETPEVLKEWQKPFQAKSPRETASAKGEDGQNVSGVDPADLRPPQVELNSPTPAEASAVPQGDEAVSDANSLSLIPVKRPDDPPAPPAALMELPAEVDSGNESMLQPPVNARPEGLHPNGLRLPSNAEVVQTSALGPVPQDVIPAEVHRLLQQGKLSEALLELTRKRYGPSMETIEAKRIDSLLNQLAGSVIYSEKSYLEPPYQVQPGDTWENLAGRFGTTPAFLARINALDSKKPLTVGQTLKIVRGPFDGTIRLGRREMVLTVNGRYAGRFPVAVGDAVRGLSGSFIVQSKTNTPTYHDGNNAFPPGNPNNPLGDCMINLDRGIGLHGTTSPETLSHDGGPGWIRLSNRDIRDLDAILSVGSRIVIQP